MAVAPRPPGSGGGDSQPDPSLPAYWAVEFPVLELRLTSVITLVSYGVLSREDVEDILHMTFLRILRKCGSYNATKGTPATWACAVARNLARDFRRKKKRAPTASLDVIRDSGSSSPLRADPSQEDPAVLAAQAEELAAQAEKVARLVRALDSLLEEERQLLDQHYREGKSWEKLAEELGVSPDTLRSQALRLRARLFSLMS